MGLFNTPLKQASILDPKPETSVLNPQPYTLNSHVGSSHDQAYGLGCGALGLGFRVPFVVPRFSYGTLKVGTPKGTP